MGLFGRSNSYMRAGKGISKEEAKRRDYFDILKRRFFKLFQLNLLYFLVNILFFAVFAYLVYPLLFSHDAVYRKELLDTVINPILAGRMPVPIIYFIPLMFIGPTTAGLTYVVRNYVNQGHAFLMSDFFDKTKKNFLQAFLASVIFSLITYGLLSACIIYSTNPTIKPIASALFIVLMVLVISASFYVYPIMVTFKIKLRHIFMNSFIFAIMRLPYNLLIILILGVVHYVLFNLPVLWAILMAVILISWSSYTIIFFSWPAIEKFMLSKVSEEERDHLLK